ncbi:MAG: serine/threonine-protein kinase [Acidobacteria bacterium]|nr:serine/threonine-protein kinase [Acidobacteriota bacterium]
MSITTGARLGPYEIIDSLGAGGMGQVWRARDTRLDRQVAIKVLPSGFAENAEFLQRFEREAKAISSLNHPHICTLHDAGEARLETRESGLAEDSSLEPRPPSLHYLVMELIEGESLADRLKKGALPLHEVLRYGRQIASALDAAHRRGVIHRDLKPGNIMLTRSGAKLLDFGLAKSSAGGQGVIEGLTSLPTEHKPLTQEGTILGTFQYMAPEQLEGTEADARTDIFALGAVLYEMATGRRAFQGGTKTSLIAAIVSQQPEPISDVTPMTPPALDHVVRRCLEKDPDDRWQSAHDIASELQWISEAGSQAGVASSVAIRRKTRERLAWILAGLTTVVALVFVALWIGGRREPEPLETSVWSIIAPAELRYDYGFGGLTISPDGKRIAFLGRSEDANTRIWIRRSDALEPRRLQGTEGAVAPFWSPDSRSVAFFADGKLKRIDADGGPAQVLADALQPRGGTWGPDGTIVFCPAYAELHTLSLSGGGAKPLTKLREGETNHRWPVFLSDGRHLLYLAQAADRGAANDQSAIYVLDVESGKEKRLIEVNSAPIWSSAGYLLFWKEGYLLAQRLDVERLELRGQPFPVAEGVDYTNWEYPVAAVSDTGTLVYHTASGAGQSELVWYDRGGTPIETVLREGTDFGFALSSDDRRIVFMIVNDRSAGADLWIRDLERKTQSRLTFQAGDEFRPFWSTDDEWIYYGGSEGGHDNIYRKRSNGLGSHEMLLTEAWPQDIFPDGDKLLITVLDRENGAEDIAIASIETGKTEPLIATPFEESQARLSPDARYLVYTSMESGVPEVYVQSLEKGGKWQLSTIGGVWPLWIGDEIFFMNPPRTELWVVPVSTNAGLVVGTPAKLLELPFMHGRLRPYTVSSDGGRILAGTFGSTATSSPLTLVENWHVRYEDQAR